MADETATEETKGHQQKAVDVFTHSSTGFPGAWTEEEINMLLDAWQEVVETARSPSRRFNVVQKVLARIRRKGFRRVERDVIRKQMNTLRTEYKTYQGLVKIGIPTVRASCVNQLDRILATPTRIRQDSETTNQVDVISEDSDHSHRLSVSYGEDDAVNNGTQSLPEMTANQTEEEATSQTRRVRFQRRLNIQRSIRAMINQQQNVLDQIQRVFKSIEESNLKIIGLLEGLVDVRKERANSQTPEVQESSKESEDVGIFSY